MTTYSRNVPERPMQFDSRPRFKEALLTPEGEIQEYHGAHVGVKQFGVGRSVSYREIKHMIDLTMHDLEHAHRRDFEGVVLLPEHPESSGVSMVLRYGGARNSQAVSLSGNQRSGFMTFDTPPMSLGRDDRIGIGGSEQYKAIGVVMTELSQALKELTDVGPQDERFVRIIEASMAGFEIASGQRQKRKLGRSAAGQR